MTAEDFNAAAARLGLSRRRFCERLGIARRTGDAYALGRQPIPRTVALAIAALEAGLDAETPPASGCGGRSWSR